MGRTQRSAAPDRHRGEETLRRRRVLRVVRAVRCAASCVVLCDRSWGRAACWLESAEDGQEPCKSRRAEWPGGVRTPVSKQPLNPTDDVGAARR